MARKREEPGADDLEAPGKPKGAPVKKERKTASKKPSKGAVDAQESLDDAVPARTEDAEGLRKGSIDTSAAVGKTAEETGEAVHQVLDSPLKALRENVPPLVATELMKSFENFLEAMEGAVTDEAQEMIEKVKDNLRTAVAEIIKAANELRDISNPLKENAQKVLQAQKDKLPTGLLDEFTRNIESHLEIMLQSLKEFSEKKLSYFFEIRPVSGCDDEKALYINLDLLKSLFDIHTAMVNTFTEMNPMRHVPGDLEEAHKKFRDMKKKGRTVEESIIDLDISKIDYEKIITLLTDISEGSLPEEQKNEKTKDLKNQLLLSICTLLLMLQNSIAGQKKDMERWLIQDLQEAHTNDPKKYYSDKRHRFFHEGEAVVIILGTYYSTLKAVVASQRLLALLFEEPIQGKST